MAKSTSIVPSLKNPFDEEQEVQFTVPGQIANRPGAYEGAMKMGHALMKRPYQAAGVKNIRRQHHPPTRRSAGGLRRSERRWRGDRDRSR